MEYTDDELDKRFKVPKEDLDDKAMKMLQIVSATSADYLSSIGVVGAGAVAQAFNFLLPSSLQKRTENWMGNAADAFKEIFKRLAQQERILSELEKDEVSSIYFQTTNIALRTHDDEKHKMLKCALINSIDPTISFDVKTMYVRLVDSLTPLHIKVLQLLSYYFFDGETAYLNDYSKIFTKLKPSFRSDSGVLLLTNQMFRVILKDLENSSLMVISDDFEGDEPGVRMQSTRLLETGDADDKKPSYLITHHGENFLEYIWEKKTESS